jgi:sec-independent protein translocase protein TatB
LTLFYDAKTGLEETEGAGFAHQIPKPLVVWRRYNPEARDRMLSIPHLIIIFVVALVVFGPEKLPELARTLGKVMGEFRRATGDLRSTFEDHLRDLEREADLRRIGEGTTYQPPAPNPATGTTQANVPSPVPASAPNAPERLEAPAYESAETASSADSNGSSEPGRDRDSESTSTDSEPSAEAGPSNTNPETPHVTRS